MAQLAPDCATQMEYFVETDSAFCVLSDQSTVVGVSYADRNIIIKHSITDLSQPMVTYSANMGGVCTLRVDERQNVFFAGGFNFDGKVVQYDLSTGQVVKAFDHVRVGAIWSSIRVDNLWIFGGIGESKFAVIDSVSRQVLGEPVESAILRIFSMTIWKIQGENNHSQALLLTVGYDPNYSENKTDVFDITALVDKHSNLSNKQILSES